MSKILIIQFISFVAVRGSTTSKLFQMVTNIDAADWLAASPIVIPIARY
jgi:hypothetical protein